MLSQSDYCMGWVCALSLEAAAASFMLDEVHPRLPQSSNDSNTYMLGRIGNHNIVILCLPNGIYGTTAATASVVQMRFTFPQIQSAVMVGIGGGVPTTEIDMRLGDVVVSQPKGTSGGVIQYDYGKTTAGGQFERVGVLNKPPSFFLTALAQLQVKYMTGSGQVSKEVAKLLAQNPSMKSIFSRPAVSNDVLYRSDYDHIASNDTCALCDEGQIIHRAPRSENEPVRVHYGLIASGNQVMKHGRTRDRLAKDLGILCFEMEAAGLMDQVPCLVIRGVCDYSDSHKNKDWQGYAALTAAVFAKELLSVVSARQNTETQDTYGKVGSLDTKSNLAFSPQAKHLISSAYRKLKKTIKEIYYEESLSFSDTSVEDVEQKARAIERDLNKSQSLRNLRRVRPFLDKTSIYSNAISTLCDGGSHIPWLWAPAGLLLKISSQDPKALENVLEVYKDVAELLPTSDTLSKCQISAVRHRLLALIYVDVLSLYKELFLIFHDKYWKVLFITIWEESEHHLKMILKNLAEVCEYMAQEQVTTTSIDELMDLRERRLEDQRKTEQTQAQSRLNSVLAWLEINEEQDDDLDRLFGLQYGDSCAWMLATNTIRRWRGGGSENPVAWLTGKPGAGKSVLSASIIHSLKQDPKAEVLYYLCGYTSRMPTSFTHLLKTLVAQLVHGNHNRAAYIYSEFIRKGVALSEQRLKSVLNVMLSATAYVRVVIDGIDELPDEEQEKVLNFTLKFRNSQFADSCCKVLLSSRDTALISGRIGRSPAVHLNNETAAVQKAIKGFVHHELSIVRLGFENIHGHAPLEDIERELVEKADGMFLWVRLVSSLLKQAATLTELRDIISQLPKGLEEMYRRIVHQILESSSEAQKATKFRVIFWILYGKKPLRKHEILSGASIHVKNVDFSEQNRLQDAVLGQCKPLLEEGANNTIRLVHFTAYEYFVRGSGSYLVPPAEAHFNIAFACLEYLGGMNLIDPKVSIEDRNNQVARGFHIICYYAYENWLHHLQFCLKNSTKLVDKQLNMLLAQIQRLYGRQCELEPPVTRGSEACQFSQTLHHSELTGLPLVGQFLQDSLQFRQKIGNEVFTRGADADNFRIQNDPTVLSEMLQNYCRTMQELYAAVEADGVTNEQLTWFKRQFGHLIYMCRFTKCRYTSSSLSDVEDHESTRHTGGIKCSEPSCCFSRIGFSSSKALKTHLGVYHPVEKLASGAEVIKKNFSCEGCPQKFRLEAELLTHQQSRNGTPCGRSIQVMPAGANRMPNEAWQPQQGGQPMVPQQSPLPGSKAAPKKKGPKEARKRPTRRGAAAASTALTPERSPTPTPATPITPQHHQPFNKSGANGITDAPQQPTSARAQQTLVQPTPPDQTQPSFGDLAMNDPNAFSLDFSALENPDSLDTFNFETFLADTDAAGLSFDPSLTYPDSVETGVKDSL